MVRGCLKQEIKMRLIGRQRGDQEQGEGVLTQSWRLNRRPPPARAARVATFRSGPGHREKEASGNGYSRQ